MRNRPNLSVLDSNEWQFEIASQSGSVANLAVLTKNPSNEQKPRHGVRRQTAAGTQHMQHGTAMLTSKRQAAGNAFTNGIAAVIGEAAALAKLSRPCTGAPFAHMGQHLMRIGRQQQGHRQPVANDGSSAPADTRLQSSPASQHQHSQCADLGSTSGLEQARMQKHPLERAERRHHAQQRSQRQQLSRAGRSAEELQRPLPAHQQAWRAARLPGSGSGQSCPSGSLQGAGQAHRISEVVAC